MTEYNPKAEAEKCFNGICTDVLCASKDRHIDRSCCPTCLTYRITAKDMEQVLSNIEKSFRSAYRAGLERGAEIAEETIYELTETPDGLVGKSTAIVRVREEIRKEAK